VERLDYQLEPGDAERTVGELALRLAGEAGAIAVARGGAWVNGRRVSDSAERVEAGALFTLRFPPTDRYGEVELCADDIAYEDEWLLAVHKRQGWYVSATPWDAEGNLLVALNRFLAARDGATPPLHLAHRLDRDTTGLLLVSRSPAANKALQAAFAGDAVTKRYLALCAGLPSWVQTELRSGHGRSAGGRWRLYPLEQVGRALPGGSRVKEAWSSFALERALDGAALVRATLHTGRTHQIRLHLAELGHPLLGDTRYGGSASYAGVTLAGHLLHAAELQLPHPVTGALLRLASPLPQAFLALLGGA
jgi:23S rRNA pseudouridine1911/1915/1917 synthase